MKGRVLIKIFTKHPHPNPPPSMGRELFNHFKKGREKPTLFVFIRVK